MKNSRFWEVGYEEFTILGGAVEGYRRSRHRRHYGAHDHVMYGPRPVLLNHSPVALIIVAGDYQ